MPAVLENLSGLAVVSVSSLSTGYVKFTENTKHLVNQSKHSTENFIQNNFAQNSKNDLPENSFQTQKSDLQKILERLDGIETKIQKIQAENDKPNPDEQIESLNLLIQGLQDEITRIEAEKPKNPLD